MVVRTADGLQTRPGPTVAKVTGTGPRDGVTTHSPSTHHRRGSGPGGGGKGVDGRQGDGAYREHESVSEWIVGKVKGERKLGVEGVR